jgi:hypothetical protein
MHSTVIPHALLMQAGLGRLPRPPCFNVQLRRRVNMTPTRHMMDWHAMVRKDWGR